MKLNLCFSLMLAICACNSGGGSKNDSKDTANLYCEARVLNKSGQSKDVIALNILDSINLKLVLSPEQIQKMKLGSFLAVYPNSIFIGDTVYFRKSHFPIGIIDFSDKTSCVYKYLIVFDSASFNSTDNKDLQMSCDTEEGDSIEADTFAIMDDSTFSTTQTFKPSARDTSKAATMTQLWKISSDGKIRKQH